MHEDYLYHYGVKGMRWGHRKTQERTGAVRSKNGDYVYLERNRGGMLARALGKVSKKVRKEQSRSYNYDIKVGNKKVGDFQMYRKSDDEMNIVWGDTKSKYRNRGYMQATYKIGEQIARQYGVKKLTAELVGNSPDIHRIANKNNFKVVGEIKTKEVLDAWGGLTLVEKDLTKN